MKLGNAILCAFMPGSMSQTLELCGFCGGDESQVFVKLASPLLKLSRVMSLISRPVLPILPLSCEKKSSEVLGISTLLQHLNLIGLLCHVML